MYICRVIFCDCTWFLFLFCFFVQLINWRLIDLIEYWPLLAQTFGKHEMAVYIRMPELLGYLHVDVSRSGVVRVIRCTYMYVQPGNIA